MNKIIKLSLFVVAVFIGILLDLLPIQVPNGIDKVYHFIGFALITMCAISTFVAFVDKKWLNYFLIFLLVFGGIFAGMAEFVQKCTIMRNCSVEDWVVNLSGIVFVTLFVFLANAKEAKNHDVFESCFELKDFS
jgi:VanZ family protein